MSYDITIQSDDAHSQEVDLEALKSFIRDIPDMNQEWETGFTYGDGARYYMEVDLEFAADNGNAESNPVRGRGTVNQINMHIPAANFHQDTVEGTPYAAICLQIARHLGWWALDLQTGEYLTG